MKFPQTSGIVNTAIVVTMMLPTTRTAVSRAVARHYSRSAIQKAEPKMHKVAGNWDSLMTKRPIDHDDLHVSSYLCCWLLRSKIPNSF